jgi:hypothetical protein
MYVFIRNITLQLGGEGAQLGETSTTSLQVHLVLLGCYIA